MGEAWYVCRCKDEFRTFAEQRTIAQGYNDPHALTYAALHLQRRGFNCFYPVRMERRRIGGRLTKVVAPLFNGYLFIAFDIQQPQRKQIHSTYGVRHLIPIYSDIPLAVAPAFIDALKSASALAEVEELIKPFARDAVVNVLFRAFAGSQGAVVSSNWKKTRIRLVTFGGRETVATLKTVDLAAVSEA